MPISIARTVQSLLLLEQGLAQLKDPSLRAQPARAAIMRLGVVKSFELTFDQALQLIARVANEVTGRPRCSDEEHAALIARACELDLIRRDWVAFQEMRNAVGDKTKFNRLLGRLPQFVRGVQQLLIDLRDH